MDENQNFSLKEIRVAKCDFYISTRNGKNDEVSKGFLNLREMIFLGKSMVQHTIDLSMEMIVKDNRQIFDLLETLRIDAIRNVRLSKIVRKVKRYCLFLVPSPAKLQSRWVKCEQLCKLVHK